MHVAPSRFRRLKSSPALLVAIANILLASVGPARAALAVPDMAWLHHEDFKVIALRDRARYVHETAVPANPMESIERRKKANDHRR